LLVGQALPNPPMLAHIKGTFMKQLTNKEVVTLRKLLKEFNNTLNRQPTVFTKYDFSKWILQNNDVSFDKDVLENFYDFELQRKRKRDAEYNKNFIRKSLRFTHEEWEKIEQQLKVADIDFTSFSKNALLKHKIKFPSVQRYLFEVNRIGNNLNQIARSLNSGDELSTSILYILISIEKKLKALYDC